VETEDGRLVYWPADGVQMVVHEPAYVADRTPTPPDCSHLRRRWQELQRDAVLLEFRVPSLRRAAEAAQAACAEAQQRVAQAQERLADLEPRSDAPNYYTRMAWLQQELSSAQAEASAACAQVDRAAADAANAEAAAAEARAEAEAARADYEACMEGAGR
jgi:chromosome segregation ATPase